MLIQDARNAVGVNCRVVPSRDSELGLVPRRRDVAVWPMKDSKRLATRGEMLPLRVGARHVRHEGAVAAHLRVKLHRKVTRKRGAAVVSNECGEAVPLNERSELTRIIHSKSGRNIHGETTGRARMCRTLRPCTTDLRDESG